MEQKEGAHSSFSMRSTVSSGSSHLSLERELEDELQLELQKLEEIFRTEHQNEESNGLQHPANISTRSKLSYSAYEYAEAEGEKEEMQDRLQLLLSKTEEFDSQLAEMNRINMDLKAENHRKDMENIRLKKQLEEISISNFHGATTRGSNGEDLLSDAIMLKLAEVQEKLIKAEQDYDDLLLSKEVALRELEQERMTRIHIEKERDAYSAAYEASLRHFEKWTQSKRGDANS